MNDSIAVFFTGGTIGSALAAEGEASPDAFRSRDLQELVERFFADLSLNVTLHFPWGERGLDSSSFHPGHWVALTRQVVGALEGGARGILILHGTDTMAYSSAWMSLALGEIDCPVVFTGSQLTLDSIPDDVAVNLRGAAAVAASRLAGVWIYFNWKLFQGRRVHKARALHPDAFVAVGDVPFFFTPEQAGRLGPSRPRSGCLFAPELKVILGLSEDQAWSRRKEVAWITAAPGLMPRFSGEEKVVVILGQGAGNASVPFMEEIVSFWEGRRKPLLLACSLAEGDEKRPEAYKDVGLAWLSRRGFGLWSQGDYPLEFIHGLAWFALLGNSADPGSVLSRYLRRL